MLIIKPQWFPLFHDIFTNDVKQERYYVESEEIFVWWLLAASYENARDIIVKKIGRRLTRQNLLSP
mgnify:FL=1